MTWNVLYILDLFAILTFAISYYRYCYRKGYRIDFWHTQLFLFCILPNMIMLPFAKSELNALVLGKDMAAVVAVLPTVFLISLLGYFAVLGGGALWSLHMGIGARTAAAKALNIVPRCSMMLMSSRSVLVFQSALCLLLQCVILAVYFSQSGFGFDLRGFTFANPTLRPIALIASNYSIIIGSHCLARYVDKKERALLVCTLLLSFGLLFFGSRTNLINMYINVSICFLVKLRARISLFRIFRWISVVLVAGLYLGNARAGEYSPVYFLASLAFLLFYGNNFSDLRDFAWVYSAWDHVFWMGRTYLSALMAFIPRFASSFRDTWALGATTASTVGFDPQVHPGLRPGFFGEGFFNFGVFGVIAVGLFLGFVLRRVDLDIKRAFTSSQPSMMKAFAPTMLFGMASFAAISSGFSEIYVIAAIYAFTWFCLSIERMFKPRKILLNTAR